MPGYEATIIITCSSADIERYSQLSASFVVIYSCLVCLGKYHPQSFVTSTADPLLDVHFHSVTPILECRLVHFKCCTLDIRVLMIALFC